MGKLIVVVGGQYGSEAKGRAVQFLAQIAASTEDEDGRVAVMRVGGPNAGHCVQTDAGHLLKLRQLPSGATIPGMVNLIGPGSEVDPVLLANEVEDLRSNHGLWPYPIVDRQATLLEERHRKSEDGMNGRLGSTQSGTGAARADRVMRHATLASESLDPLDVADTVRIARTMLLRGGTVIVEGVQGYGLGQHAGDYPQCTSIDCTAIDALSMAGISPWDENVDEFEVWVVFRTHPIRVAGNSGPMVGETSWDELGLPKEITTVTKRVRRVGEWDPVLASRAVDNNGGATRVKVFLSMIDHVEPALANVAGPVKQGDYPALDDWADRVFEDTGVVPSYFGTGPATTVWYQRYA